jgi:hypothetical protein
MQLLGLQKSMENFYLKIHQKIARPTFEMVVEKLEYMVG